jgi:hypothetical protein
MIAVEQLGFASSMSSTNKSSEMSMLNANQSKQISNAWMAATTDQCCIMRGRHAQGGMEMKISLSILCNVYSTPFSSFTELRRNYAHLSHHDNVNLDKK